MNYKNEIENYPAVSPEEIGDKRLILKYITNFPNTILTRENEYAHITSSSMIFNHTKDKVLMVYHNIYNSWSWTGGHADGNSDLLAVALKEAQEETGICNFILLSREIIAIDILPVWGHKKKGNYISSHQHLNVTYSLMADEHDVLKINPDENSDVSWIPICKLKEFISEPDMLPIYEKIINKVLKPL